MIGLLDRRLCFDNRRRWRTVIELFFGPQQRELDPRNVNYARFVAGCCGTLHVCIDKRMQPV